MFVPHPYNATSSTFYCFTLLHSVINFIYSFSPIIPKVSSINLGFRLFYSLRPSILLNFMMLLHSPKPIYGSHSEIIWAVHSIRAGLLLSFKAKKWFAPASIMTRFYTLFCFTAFKFWITKVSYGWAIIYSSPAGSVIIAVCETIDLISFIDCWLS